MNERKGIDKRMFILFGVLAVILLVVVFRLLYIQNVKGDEYRQLAYDQYTTEMTINPRRGTIYDRNLKEMALSVTVEDCIIDPNRIRENHSSAEQNQLAHDLSEILDVDYETVLARIGKNSRYQMIRNKLDLNLADRVRALITEKGYKGIHLIDNTKRYYPGGTLASTVLGFTDFENKGVMGVEKQYENHLKGVAGRVVTAQNGRQQEMPFKYESYIEAENGTNVVLTIDWTVQSFLEKQLDIALEENRARNKVCGIVMDVDTCEILAMASKPDFDPNEYSKFTDQALQFYDSYFARPENKDANDTDYLNYLWKNKALQEPYEPGSTFKIVTSAMALEEGVVNESDRFTCVGVVNVAGWPIHCHKTGGHGTESFEQGLQNSCNPVFVALAQRLGKTRFYNYYKAFGCAEPTGIDLPSEASTIWHSDINNFNETELAVYSFGQTFKITPIRLLTTLCAVANGGKLMKPYIVKKLVDDDGNTIESFSPTLIRQISSSKTSETIMTYLYNGINVGSTKNAYVKGYKIAAKTGTSQKRDMPDGYYISSCVSFAPADDPKIAILVIVDEPSAGAFYGGTVAAPIASAVLSDVLPYLNIAQTYSEDEKSTLEVALPKYTGMNVEEAKAKAKTDGFRCIVKGSGDVVNEQLPRYTSKIPAGGTVIFYTGSEVPASDVLVPNVVGYSASQASGVLANSGLNISISGAYREGVGGAIAIKQNPAAGDMVRPGTAVTVEFKHTDSSD